MASGSSTLYGCVVITGGPDFGLYGSIQMINKGQDATKPKGSRQYQN